MKDVSAFLRHCILAPGWGGVALCLVALPLLALVAHTASLFLPYSFYYAISRNAGYAPLTLLLPLAAGAGCVTLLAVHALLKRLGFWWRVPAYAALLLGIAAATLSLAAAAVIVMPARYNLGHPYCRSDLLIEIERCEGTDRGALQDRRSAVAIFGPPIIEIGDALSVYPDYNLYEVACADLIGGFGDRCFTGSAERPTGDTDFMAVYTTSGAALVLQTENIAPVKGDKAGFVPQDNLKEFVDLNRFSDEF